MHKSFWHKNTTNILKYPKKGTDLIIHPPICYAKFTKLHHSAHSRSTAHWHCGLLLWFVNNQTFGCQEHTGD